MTYRRIPGAPIPENEKPATARQLAALVGKPLTPPGLTMREITAALHSGVQTVVPLAPDRMAWVKRYIAPPSPPPIVNAPHSAADIAGLNAIGKQLGVQPIPHHSAAGEPTFLVMGHAGVQEFSTLEDAKELMRRTAAIRACGG